MNRFLLCSSLALLVGCNSSTAPVTSTPAENPTPPEPTAVTVADDADALAAVIEITDKVKRDGDGLVVEVDFRGASLTDTDLEGLSKLPRLRSVLLSDTAITDEALKTLGEISTMQNLDLRECAVTDAGLAHLTGLQKLKVLKLSGKDGDCSISDDGMEQVGKLKALKVLAIDFLWVSEDGLAKLDQLAEMIELYMAGTSVGSESIELIAKQFPKLKKLRLAQTHIDGTGTNALPGLSNLEELDISECLKVNDEGLQPLAKMSHIKNLNLWRLNISDAGVASLAGLTTLQRLNLDNTRLSDEGMQHLSDLKELTWLHLGSTQISDAGLSNLDGLTKLKNLIVTRTNVTKEGTETLQEKLPETKIQLEYLGGE